jgi:hypothetical protein
MSVITFLKSNSVWTRARRSNNTYQKIYWHVPEDLLTYAKRSIDTCQKIYWHVPKGLLTRARRSIDTCQKIYWHVPKDLLTWARSIDTCQKIYWHVPKGLLARARRSIDTCQKIYWHVPEDLSIHGQQTGRRNVGQLRKRRTEQHPRKRQTGLCFVTVAATAVKNSVSDKTASKCV